MGKYFNEWLHSSFSNEAVDPRQLLMQPRCCWPMSSSNYRTTWSQTKIQLIHRSNANTNNYTSKFTVSYIYTSVVSGVTKLEIRTRFRQVITVFNILQIPSVDVNKAAQLSLFITACLLTLNSFAEKVQKMYQARVAVRPRFLRYGDKVLTRPSSSGDARAAPKASELATRSFNVPFNCRSLSSQPAFHLPVSLPPMYLNILTL